MTKKGIFSIGLFVIFLIAIAIWAQTIDNDPLLYTLAGYIVVAVLSMGAILFKPFRIRFEEFANKHIFVPSKKLRILVVGLGRSGKTSIIRHVLTDESPKREKSTTQFIMYDKILKIGLNDPVEYIVAIADYKGQKLSQITNDKSFYPDFFGKPGQKLVNVIIFVVDLFPEMRNKRGELLTDEQIVMRSKKNPMTLINERVIEHQFYNTIHNIEQIIELASPKNLFSVRLLINKIDLLREAMARGYLPEVNEKNMEKYSKDLFKKISDDIRKACEDNKIEDFSVHIVSAKTGDNMKIVFGNIFETYIKRSQQ
jgi:GTPase SAR1 family protein